MEGPGRGARRLGAVALGLLTLAAACGRPTPTQAPAVTLRLGVNLTPQELASYSRAITALDEAHPEWRIVLEASPQLESGEKINAQLASGTLPDVIRLSNIQQWVDKGAFLDLTDHVAASSVDLTDFYPGPLEQYRWRGRLWGLPDTASPDVVYYNRAMFDAAGLAYPTDRWTYEDMRRAAVRLTLDRSGRTPADPGFDPVSVVQWGWNGGLTYFWQRHLVQAFGGDLCANEDCTVMSFTSPAALEAARWWTRLVHDEHAGLYDPYGGSQTGTPGDPFVAGRAAMGYNGSFAVGQLNEAGNIAYDIVQPFAGLDGSRHTSLSTNGYVISARTAHPEAAWALLQALVEPEFLTETWGRPGHAVPARRSAASSIVDLSHPPANQQAILAAMEYAEVFKPYTASAFEVYAMTGDLFQKMMRGDLPVEQAMRQIEDTANRILARDRIP